jgi:hypothetical protein
MHVFPSSVIGSNWLICPPFESYRLNFGLFALFFWDVLPSLWNFTSILDVLPSSRTFALAYLPNCSFASYPMPESRWCNEVHCGLSAPDSLRILSGARVLSGSLVVVRGLITRSSKLHLIRCSDLVGATRSITAYSPIRSFASYQVPDLVGTTRSVVAYPPIGAFRVSIIFIAAHCPIRAAHLVWCMLARIPFPQKLFIELPSLMLNQHFCAVFALFSMHITSNVLAYCHSCAFVPDFCTFSSVELIVNLYSNALRIAVPRTLSVHYSASRRFTVSFIRPS